MTWIKELDFEKESGDLWQFYDQFIRSLGYFPPIYKVSSLRPGVMRAHHRLFTEVMSGESSLSRKQREMIALVVSSLNGCFY